MQDVSKVVEYVEQSDKLRAEAKELMSKADKVLNEARELCPHTVTINKDDYYKGGYMDRASTTTRTYCNICGKLVNTHVTEHSWYG